MSRLGGSGASHTLNWLSLKALPTRQGASSSKKSRWDHYGDVGVFRTSSVIAGLESPITHLVPKAMELHGRISVQEHNNYDLALGGHSKESMWYISGLK